MKNKEDEHRVSGILKDLYQVDDKIKVPDPRSNAHKSKNTKFHQFVQQSGPNKNFDQFNEEKGHDNFSVDCTHAYF